MAMALGQLQERIRELYGAKDAARGVEGTFMWFMEEVGELSAALRNGTAEETTLEFADVLAWLVTLANCQGIDLEDAIAGNPAANECHAWFGGKPPRLAAQEEVFPGDGREGDEIEDFVPTDESSLERLENGKVIPRSHRRAW